MGILRKIADRFDPAETRAAALPLDGNPFVPLFSPSPHVAENLSTVFACVSAISSALSALPAYVYRNSGNTRQEVNTGALAALIKNGPNPYQTWPEFVEFLVAQVILRGNGLIEIETNRRGDVIGLRVIPWHWCNVQMLASGKLIYDVYDQPGVYSPAQGRRRRLLQNEVIHIRDRSDDGLIGLPRLQRCAATVATARAINHFTSSIYENGLYPSAVVTTVRDMSPEARQAVRQSYEETLSGPQKAAKLLILPGGDFNWQTLSITPEDAELLASRKYSTEELCRVFQVPPPIIQDYSHNTFTNSEQAGRWFAQFCLLPWIRKIESAFNRALFPGGRYELSLDMSGLTRGDDAARWQAHEIAARNEILSIDEIREIEGFSPKPQESETGKNNIL